MSQEQTYKQIGVVPVVPSVDPVSLAINAALVALPFVFKAFAHPARDERNRIEGLKKQIVGLDPVNRLRFVIENSAQTSAPDVTAREWFLWYRKNFSQDYQTLSYSDKVLFNDFMAQFGNRYASNVDTLQSCKAAMFSDSELSFGQSKAEQILSSPSSKYLIIGAIGLGLLLLLKK